MRNTGAKYVFLKLKRRTAGKALDSPEVKVLNLQNLSISLVGTGE